MFGLPCIATTLQAQGFDVILPTVPPKPIDILPEYLVITSVPLPRELIIKQSIGRQKRF